jgi:hypothetical protein
MIMESNSISISNNKYYYDLTKDIKNFYPLSEEQIEFIKTLPHHELINIIKIYNKCIKCID